MTRRTSYIALHATDGARLNIFSTEMMQWAPTVWLIDLTDFRSYWERRAEQVGLTVLGLWRRILLAASFLQAAHSDSPLKAVVLLAAIGERAIQGLLSTEQGWGMTVYDEASWDAWWQAMTPLGDHYATHRVRGFQRARFAGDCHRFQLSMQRLNIARPSAMRGFNYPACKRRFGLAIADIWRFLFNAHEGLFGNSDFPWTGFQNPEVPEVCRYLDFPAQQWDQIAGLLCEDFDRLAPLLRERDELVLDLEWELTFDAMINDSFVALISVGFRNPHDLSQDRGQQRAALAQAEHSFGSVMAALHEDLIAPYPGIIGWKIAVRKSLHSPAQSLSLFESAVGETAEQQELCKLENELGVTLRSYVCTNDLSPEFSFRLRSLSEREEICATPESLNNAALQRPLFTFVQRDAMRVKSVEGCFTEAVLSHWWDTPPSAGWLERHYYRHRDSAGKLLWIYRQGEVFYRHGIFG